MKYKEVAFKNWQNYFYSNCCKTGNCVRSLFSRSYQKKPQCIGKPCPYLSIETTIPPCWKGGMAIRNKIKSWVGFFPSLFKIVKFPSGNVLEYYYRASGL